MAPCGDALAPPTVAPHFVEPMPTILSMVECLLMSGRADVFFSSVN